MEILLYFVLVLALVGDVLLAILLVRSSRPQKPQGPTADDVVNAMTPVLQGETDLLAEQLRAMQGESARTTTATLRDFSAVLAENQRQNAAASTARLESIDRAGAARQKAANDALIAQLTMMETRLKNLEDSNAARLDGVRGALVQGLNTIRADNNQKLDEIRGTVEEKLQDTLQKRINESFRAVSTQLEQVYKGLGEMPRRRCGQPEAGAFRRKDPRHFGRGTAGRNSGTDFGPRSVCRERGHCSRQRQPRRVCHQDAGAERQHLAAHRRQVPR